MAKSRKYKEDPSAQKVRDPAGTNKLRPSDIHTPRKKPLVDEDARGARARAIAEEMNARARSTGNSPKNRAKDGSASEAEPGANQNRPADELYDYNIVAMSEFKQNPSAYLLRSKDIPVAITRYGRIDGLLLTVQSYNVLLERIRNLKADISEARHLLETVSPGLVNLLDANQKATESWPLPNWPMFRQLPRRRRTGLITEEGMDRALEEMKALTEAVLAHKARMDEESAERWQRIPRDEKPIQEPWA